MYGPPLFIKAKFGLGYHLSITIRDGYNGDAGGVVTSPLEGGAAAAVSELLPAVAACRSLVCGFVPSAELASVLRTHSAAALTGTAATGDRVSTAASTALPSLQQREQQLVALELTFLLPRTEVGHFPALCRALESTSSSSSTPPTPGLDVVSFSATCSTLDDVFQRVAEIVEEEQAAEESKRRVAAAHRVQPTAASPVSSSVVAASAPFWWLDVRRRALAAGPGESSNSSGGASTSIICSGEAVHQFVAQLRAAGIPVGGWDSSTPSALLREQQQKGGDEEERGAGQHTQRQSCDSTRSGSSARTPQPPLLHATLATATAAETTAAAATHETSAESACIKPPQPPRSHRPQALQLHRLTHQVRVLLWRRYLQMARDRQAVLLFVFSPLLFVGVSLVYQLLSPIGSATPAAPTPFTAVGFGPALGGVVSGTSLPGTQLGLFGLLWGVLSGGTANDDAAMLVVANTTMVALNSSGMMKVLPQLNNGSPLGTTAAASAALAGDAYVAGALLFQDAALPASFALTLMWNYSLTNALPVLLNAWDSGALSSLVAGASITTALDPFPPTSSDVTASIGSVLTGYLMGVYIATGWIMLPAALVSAVVQEKQSRCKQLQFILGVRPLSYWIAIYTADVSLFTLPWSLSVLLIGLAGPPVFRGGQPLAAVAVILLLFGVATPLPAYAFSFLFEKHTDAQLWTRVLGMLITLGLFVMSFVLALPGVATPTMTGALAGLDVLCVLFPPYGIIRGLGVLGSTQVCSPLLSAAGLSCAIPSPWAWDVAGRIIFWMAVGPPLWFGVLMAIEAHVGVRVGGGGDGEPTMPLSSSVLGCVRCLLRKGVDDGSSARNARAAAASAGDAPTAAAAAAAAGVEDADVREERDWIRARMQQHSRERERGKGNGPRLAVSSGGGGSSGVAAVGSDGSDGGGGRGVSATDGCDDETLGVGVTAMGLRKVFAPSRSSAAMRQQQRQGEGAKVAVADLYLHAAEGELFGLLGANGAGVCCMRACVLYACVCACVRVSRNICVASRVVQCVWFKCACCVCGDVVIYGTWCVSHGGVGENQRARRRHVARVFCPLLPSQSLPRPRPAFPCLPLPQARAPHCRCWYANSHPRRVARPYTGWTWSPTHDGH